MKPLIIAHRGYSAKHTENTLTAFSAAIDSHCDMIELDVHFSNDNQLIVFHDLKLKRITGRKKRVLDYTADELRTFNIPTLRDVFQLVHKRVPINIEIKHETINHSEYRKMMVRNLLMLLEELNVENSVVSSFDDAFLRELRSQNSDILLGVLDHGHPGQRLKLQLIKDIKAYSYHPNQRTLNQDQVDMLHDAGLKVFSYTANDIRTFQKLCLMRVDGIITNEVEQLHRYLHE
jgi:glycerophosphoryl diester phosphodiesterase